MMDVCTRLWYFFFFSSRRRHTRWNCDWSSDVCSSDLDRFPRLVRDVARQLDKQVSFRVEGKEIELDREILDELGDPLVHLLRNAVDHGIAAPAERKRRNKNPEGE